MLPSGIVTFLFTDIEGSTRLWEIDAARMAEAVARHDALCRSAVESHGGSVIKMTGDGLHAVFANPADAVATTLALQRGMQAIGDDCDVPLRMRCGLHLGVAQERDGDYFGIAVNRAARIMTAAHGAQVLLSQGIVDALTERFPDGASAVHLGRVRLRDLAAPEDLWQLRHPELRATFPPLRSLDTTPNNLPQQVTTFIGREQEVAAVKQLLVDSRLLTLTGSGGCGKTRLALQVAAEILDSYPDGVWLVELGALADPHLVPQAVAAILGLKEERGSPLTQTLIDHLSTRKLLLLLDNAEHLLAACAHLADAVLRRSAQSVLLVTSREGLGIAGERTYRVPSLSLPDRKEPTSPESLLPYEAVRLFVERAQTRVPQFAITAGNAAAIASICSRLDGIPLAIELAAARVPFISVEEINRRLDQRFRLLTGGSRTALPRQQTLRSTIDWSYALLTAGEKALICRLAVFADGWTLEAAERVCAGDGIDESVIFDLLVSLADRSLVIVEERGADMRYRLLETVRQYARDRLFEHGDSTHWRDRHLRYFLDLATEAKLELRGAKQQHWLDRLETEHDNLRAALTWSSTPGGNALEGMHLADALFQFWYVRGYFSESRGWLAALLDAAPDAPPAARAEALSSAGVMVWQQGDYPTARRFHEEALAIQRELADKVAVARALINLGAVDFDQGDYAAARARFEEALAIRRVLGTEQGVAAVLHNLGAVARAVGDEATAWQRFEESLAIYRKVGDPWGIAISLSNLGGIACDRGDDARAEKLFEESLVLRGDIGERRGIAESLEGLAAVAGALSQPERAARIWGAAERLRREISAPLSPFDRSGYDTRVAAARAAIGDEVFEQAWREGAAMTLQQAVAYASSKN